MDRLEGGPDGGPGLDVDRERRAVITSRARILAWAGIGIILMFSVASPALGGEVHGVYTLRFATLLFLVAFLFASRRPGFERGQIAWGMLLVAGIAALSARSGVLRGAIAVTGTLDLILMLLTAAVLPWGLASQASVVAITAATTGWAVWQIGFETFDVGSVFVLINVGAGGLLSLLVAHQTRTGFDRTARENHRLRAMERSNRELNRELEGEVRRQTQELQGALADQRAVTHAISHDLRQPLRHIDGYARMIEDDLGPALGSETLERLDRVRSATVRMGRMVDALLELSRVSGRLVRRRHVDLAAVAREIVDLLAAAEPDRGVELVLPERAGAQCDPGLCRDLLRELLGNAWKFTRAQADARIELGYEAGAWFVRDNGPGFQMAHTQRLFHAFERLHHVSEFEGEGMGLAIAERIVRRHGGRIWAESEPGDGATFRFTLEPPDQSLA